MKIADKLAAGLRQKHPHAILETETFRNGDVVLNIRSGPRVIVVQCKDHRPFKIWAMPNGSPWTDFNDRPTKIAKSLAAAQRSISQLLISWPSTSTRKSA